MQSWISLQLEPTALRRPDDFGAEPHLSPIGEHLPATLHRLDCPAALANDLSELLPDVSDVLIDSDEGRRLRTLKVAGRDGLEYAARSLSDGTLRFLALATMRHDPEVTGLICFEEPENGLHPSRIPAMLTLLEGIAVDPQLEVSKENPLRQVIINTHSPVVVQHLPLDTLLFARSVRGRGGDETLFQCLPGTWRVTGENPMESAPLGELLPYLTGTKGGKGDDRASRRESVLAFAAKQAELEFVFSE
jgi:predicted ATPase